VNYSNCSPAIVSDTSTDYLDANFALLGSANPSGHGVFTIPVSVPESVKIGDKGSLGRKINWVGPTRGLFNGSDQLSFAVESDSSNTAIVKLITDSYDSNDIHISTEVDAYRIDTAGSMSHIFSDLQILGSGKHLTFTETSDKTILIDSSLPASDSINVSTSDPISATFSDILDAATVNASTFSITDSSGNLVNGIVQYTGKTATYIPSGILLPDTLYTATISSAVTDLAGNHLPMNLRWQFKTVNSEFKSILHLSTNISPEAVAIGDLNGDGRNDVVMTSTTTLAPPFSNNIFHVYIQNKDGTLYTPTEYLYSNPIGCIASSVAIGDINNDGNNDIVIANGSCGIQTFLHNSSGGFDAGVVHASINNTDKIRIADINNDGLLDVVGVGWGGYSSTVSVWLQNSNGILDNQITYGIGYIGLTDIEVGDLNNDGLIDVVAIGGPAGNGNIGVLLQSQSGILTPPVYYSVGTLGLTGIPWSVAIGDLNGDSLNDVAVSILANMPVSGIVVFTQNVNGTLNPVVEFPSYESPGAMKIAGITGDGRKDIVVLHGGWNHMGVYEQQLNGAFRPEHLYETIPFDNYLTLDGLYNSNGLAIGDINGDGRPDMVSADRRNSWLTIAYHY
jgi:hypothetical protein